MVTVDDSRAKDLVLMLGAERMAKVIARIIENAGLVPKTSTPEEFAAKLKSNIDLIGRIVKVAGIKPE